jgi:hypothetical protein
MRGQRKSLFVRAGSALALMLLLGACTKSGQFDPTEIFNSDAFDSKKKLSGQREAVFPNGVPGTTTGVPVDLVKGYQPPPDPTDANASQPPPGAGPPAAGAAPGAGAPTATAEAKPKPKPKPKPKLASAPAAPAPGTAPPGGSTRLTIGSRPAAATQDQNAGAESNWPAPAQQASSPGQANWPAQPAAPSAQTNWPAPSATAPAQKTAQPSQSTWPNPPATTQ